MRGLGLLLAGLLSSGCGVFDFDVQQAVPEQRVMGSSILGTVLGNFIPSPFPLTIDIEQETKAHNTGPVKAAGLKTLTFQITATGKDSSSDVDEFDFVQSVDIFVDSTRQGSMLPRQKIADLPQPPGKVQLINMHTYPDINLLPYINEGSRITASATGNQPSDDVTFNGQIVVHVNTF